MKQIKYALKTRTPLSDPCTKCLVKVTCSDKCTEKFLFDDNDKNKKPSDIRFSMVKKRRKK